MGFFVFFVMFGCSEKNGKEKGIKIRILKQASIGLFLFHFVVLLLWKTHLVGIGFWMSVFSMRMMIDKVFVLCFPRKSRKCNWNWISLVHKTGSNFRFSLLFICFSATKPRLTFLCLYIYFSLLFRIPFFSFLFLCVWRDERRRNHTILLYALFGC